MSLQNKLDVLCHMAHTLNEKNITWNLGSSGMLFLRGIVKDFNDLDIMVANEDINQAIHIFDAMGKRCSSQSTDRYKTRYFYEYTIRDVDVDLMAELTIMAKDESHMFSIHRGETFDWTMLGHEKIYLSSTKEWLNFYRQMNRKDKVAILESTSKNHPIELVLKKPTYDDIFNIQAYRQAFIDIGESLHGGCGIMEFKDIKDWIDYLELFKEKRTVPPGRAISSEYLCIRKTDHKMVGIVNIRHELNEELLLHGGHIGYSIHPEERQKGYAHEQLRLALIECQRLGINPILITCNRDNEASRKTILHAHGVLENTFVEEDGNVVERYWVTINTKRGENI